MKHVIEINTGKMYAYDDGTAEELMTKNPGKYAYISKSEYKSGDPNKYLDLTPWYPVTSSNINSIRYSFASHTLWIKFGQPQVESMYEYQNCSIELWQGFLNAESKGKFFWANIRNNSSLHPYAKQW